MKAFVTGATLSFMLARIAAQTVWSDSQLGRSVRRNVFGHLTVDQLLTVKRDLEQELLERRMR